MLALLDQIRRQQPHGFDFAGDVERLRDAVGALPDDAPLSTRVTALGALAAAELATDVTSAIKTLELTLDLTTRMPERDRRTYAVPAAYLLGVAHIRDAQTRNCVELRLAGGCVVPIREQSIYPLQEPSRAAVRYFRQVLDATPDDAPFHIASTWLMNLAYMTLGEYPDGVPTRFLIDPATFAPESEFPYFENVAARAGLATRGYAGGTIVDDFDNDGYLDVLVSSVHSEGQLRFFRNNGDGRFNELTERAGLTGVFGGVHMVQADYDNDGDVDVFVLRGGWLGSQGRIPNSLLRNNGNLTFTDVTFDAGLGDVHYPSQSAAWVDFDNDGDVDLFVGNESTPGQRSPSQLFRNEGEGRFVEIAASAGVQNFRFTKGVSWGDYNDDGFADLYVSNFEDTNRLYRNNRDGTFTDVAPDLGVTAPISSFSTWFWDMDNDGAQDLLVTSYPLTGTPAPLVHVVGAWLGRPQAVELLKLYRNDGRGGLADVATAYGIRGPTQPMGSNYGDLDNDGYLDFYLGTGYMAYEAVMPNVMYRNVDGERFTDVTYAGGFGHLAKAHGIAFADLDNDGDQDVFTVLGGADLDDDDYDTLLENPGFGNHWITVKLIGTTSNRAAIGARIRIDIREEERARSIYRVISSGSSFCANPLRAEIGLGTADRIDLLEV
ncbi:MAG: CRTAC1 family protein, partial [Acidobacteria bacterium]|nr:CRTAC1 family protein [Acidobacteriota bacterium]